MVDPVTSSRLNVPSRAFLANALREHREFNASLEENKLRIYKDINVGVAVALEGGLIVPVIKNADVKSVTQISAELEELANAFTRKASMSSHP